MSLSASEHPRHVWLGCFQSDAGGAGEQVIRSSCAFLALVLRGCSAGAGLVADTVAGVGDAAVVPCHKGPVPKSTAQAISTACAKSSWGQTGGRESRERGRSKG